MALEGTWRADTEERPHPEAEIERAGVNEQTLQHVLVAAHVRSPKPARFVEMRRRSLEQFPAFPEKSFSAVATNATSIGVDRVAFRLLVDP